MRRLLLFILLLALSPPFLAAKAKKPKHVKKSICSAACQEDRRRRDEIRRGWNRRADEEKIARIKDDKDLKAQIKSGDLVPLPEVPFLKIDPRLDKKWRFCRPWVRDFLLLFGREFYATFGKPLQINSAARTPQYQKYLTRHNKNADPPLGDMASLHTRGIAIDFAKKGMTTGQMLWAHERLFIVPVKGTETVEEFRQLVFHVMVYKEYIQSIEIPDDTIPEDPPQGAE